MGLLRQIWAKLVQCITIPQYTFKINSFDLLYIMSPKGEPVNIQTSYFFSVLNCIPNRNTNL